MQCTFTLLSQQLIAEAHVRRKLALTNIIATTLWYSFVGWRFVHLTKL